MRMTEEVRTLMQDADPARDILGNAQQARADLDRIMHVGAVTTQLPTAQRGRKPRVRLGLTVGAACAAAALAFAVLPQGAGGTAYAATPPPLHYTTISTTLSPSAMLKRIAEHASTLREPIGPQSRLHYKDWSLNTRVYADDSVTSEIVAEDHQTVTRADGSGTERRTGEDGHTETYKTKWTPAPADPAALKAWLTRGNVPFTNAMGAAATAGELLRSQALSPVQRATLLNAIADLPGLTFDGKVTDRVGRVGQAFSAESSRSGLPTRYTFIVNSSSGTITGQEEMLTKTAGKLNVPVPSVIGYTVYLKAQRTADQ
ncbi:hypothetical protein ABZS94_34565 [Streptomyces sp. NPDC005500]|uniref:hypothetical protein n=1 Tax=Streptomyces sp. NPDC005500 TaxID=3155007 RepID=UPI0033B3CD7C